MHKAARVGVVVAAVLAAALGLAAGAGAQSQRIELVLTDYAFNPSQLALRAGVTYEIVLINRGSVEHEIMIGRGRTTETTAAGEEHGFEENFFDGIEAAVSFEGGLLEVEELVEVEVEAGHQVTLTFTVPAGKQGSWEMACFVPGHYELGMHGTLTVR